MPLVEIGASMEKVGSDPQNLALGRRLAFALAVYFHNLPRCYPLLARFRPPCGHPSSKWDMHQCKFSSAFRRIYSSAFYCSLSRGLMHWRLRAVSQPGRPTGTSNPRGTTHFSRPHQRTSRSPIRISKRFGPLLFPVPIILPLPAIPRIPALLVFRNHARPGPARRRCASRWSWASR